MTRDETIRSMFKADGLGLEIGPSYNPLLPKARGYRIETIDHASQAGLIEKYRNDPSVDCSRIEPVDYVCDGRSFVETIGATGRYDFIVASHVIEHSPDLIGFLRDCEALLRPEGVLVLAVPDKRRCFDALRPVSTTGAALQAALEQRTRHAPGSIFDCVANAVHRGNEPTWRHDSRAPLRMAQDVAVARQQFEQASADPGYFDNHSWCFTPSSFSLLLSDFNALGLLMLKEREIRGTGGLEFYAVLARDGAGPRLGRLDLLLGIERELAEAAGTLLGRIGTRAGAGRTGSPGDHAPGSFDARFRNAEERDSYLDAVLSSTSWRVTRPLRILGDFWKKTHRRR
jgi:SAM-dependent methyltransferase